MKKMILVSIILAVLFIGVFALGNYIGQTDNAGLFTLTNIMVTAKSTPAGDNMTYKLGGSTYEDYTTEKLSLSQTNNTSDGLFNNFTGSVKKNKLTYSLNFYTGINFSKSDSNISETWTDKGTKDVVKIPFMGKTYNIDKVTFSGTKIQSLELLDSTTVKSYSIGDKIENLIGKNGKEYYAVVTAVSQNDTVKISLYDLNGNTVEKNVAVAINEYFGESSLTTKVKIQNISNTGTTDNPKYTIEIIIGNVVTISEGKEIPNLLSDLSYNLFDIIPNLLGIDGKEYYAIIEGVNADQTGIVVTLYKDVNNPLPDYTQIKEPLNEKLAKDFLKTSIKVTKILNIGSVDYPEWDIQVSTDAPCWKVSGITETNKTTLKSITLVNTCDFTYSFMGN
ncbi:MAG: hypothetical protein PHH82_03830 [Candidatus ainarchaeum sp.]|nr:hypothetical protein [Candidatus ainarchaeum sp.]